MIQKQLGNLNNNKPNVEEESEVNIIKETNVVTIEKEELKIQSDVISDKLDAVVEAIKGANTELVRFLTTPNSSLPHNLKQRVERVESYSVM